MSCEEIRGWMSEYLDGVLDKDRDEGLTEHLAGCEDCRNELDTLKKTVSLLRGLEPVEPPADLIREIHSKVEKRPHGRIWYVFNLPGMRVAIAAGLLLAVVGIYSLREGTVRPTTSGVRVAQAEKDERILDKELDAPAERAAVALEKAAEVAAPAPSGAEVNGRIWRAQNTEEIPSDKRALLAIASVVEKEEDLLDEAAMRGGGHKKFKERKRSELSEDEEADERLTLKEPADEIRIAGAEPIEKAEFAKSLEKIAEGAGAARARAASSRDVREKRELGFGLKAGEKQPIDIVIATAKTASILRIIEQSASRRQTVSRLEEKRAAKARVAAVPRGPAREYRVETQADGRTIIYAGIPSGAYPEFLTKLRALGKLSVGSSGGAAADEIKKKLSKAPLDTVLHDKDEDVVAVRITILPPK